MSVTSSGSVQLSQDAHLFYARKKSTLMALTARSSRVEVHSFWPKDGYTAVKGRKTCTANNHRRAEQRGGRSNAQTLLLVLFSCFLWCTTQRPTAPPEVHGVTLQSIRGHFSFWNHHECGHKHALRHGLHMRVLSIRVCDKLRRNLLALAKSVQTIRY